MKYPLGCTSPFAEQRVHERQSQQKSYADMHRHVRSFSVGDHVVVCDLKRGQVTGKSGPYAYEVCLQDGRVFRRHQDNLRKIMDMEDIESPTIVPPPPPPLAEHPLMCKYI